MNYAKATKEKTINMHRAYNKSPEECTLNHYKFGRSETIMIETINFFFALQIRPI